MDLTRLVGVAHAAGEAILAHYGGWSTRKADGSPLTAADLAANRCIVDALPDLLDIPVVSEESPPPDEPGARFWLVDPLDGTREFLDRNGEFTVNIALVEDGRPVLGVVHAPALGTTWTGRAGAGAEVLRADGSRDALHARAPAHGPLRVVVSRSHPSPGLADFLERLRGLGRPVEEVPAGSSLKIARVAEGAAGLYPRLGPTMWWDTAAAQAVLEAAGGRVVDLHGGPLQYRGDDLRNPSFVAEPAEPVDWRSVLGG